MFVCLRIFYELIKWNWVEDMNIFDLMINEK